ncbi:MAG: Triosephosphate isomerase [Chlamydiales bacterium]|nr:Triosephosphate isomerase [Chlamydiales bacterium]
MPRKSKTSVRPTVIAGNWKMYKTIEEAKTFVETLAPLIEKSQATVYLAVPFTALASTAQQVKRLESSLVLGAQNMNDASEGAFTGEIAARMLLDVGARFVILGHSERRQLFHETSAFINQKVKRALEEGIQPILCIGETLNQREADETEAVLKEQLLASLENVSAEELARMIVAYEPIWAIGTGKVAHPKDAESAHAFIRGVVAENWGKQSADQLVIQYGGSVKPENAPELLAQSNIDGLLVGGASLSAESFSNIINGSLT